MGLALSRPTDHSGVAIELRHIEQVAVGVLEHVDRLQDGQRRRVHDIDTCTDATTGHGAPTTALHLHRFACGVHARCGSEWWVGVNMV
jgi:hypothetical protein